MTVSTIFMLTTKGFVDVEVSQIEDDIGVDVASLPLSNVPPGQSMSRPTAWTKQDPSGVRLVRKAERGDHHSVRPPRAPFPTSHGAGLLREDIDARGKPPSSSGISLQSLKLRTPYRVVHDGRKDPCGNGDNDQRRYEGNTAVRSAPLKPARPSFCPHRSFSSKALRFTISVYVFHR